jgi:hypothetical protein
MGLFFNYCQQLLSFMVRIDNCATGRGRPVCGACP